MAVASLLCVLTTSRAGADAAIPVTNLNDLRSRDRVYLGEVLVDRNVSVPAGAELVVTARARLTLRKGAIVDLSAASIIADPDAEWIDAGGALVPEFQTTLAVSAPAGSRAIVVSDRRGITAGVNIYVAMNSGRSHATTVASVDAQGRIELIEPLSAPADIGRQVTAGVHRYEPYDSGKNIDGGRMIFNPTETVSASWYLAGAGDFGYAITIANHGLREQSAGKGSIAIPSLQLHGRHKASIPADLTGWGGNSEQKLIYSDAVVTWAPAPENAPFPFLDFTDTRAVKIVGRLVVDGDSGAPPQRGVQFARGALPSHSGLHDISAIDLKGHFTVAGWIFSQAENSFGHGNTIQNAARNGVAISFNRNPSPTYAYAPRSKYQALNSTLTSFNFARSWNDVAVFAEGDDTYLQESPMHAAIVLEGVTRATLNNVYVASNIPALVLRARDASGNMASIRITDLQQHGRPNQAVSDPQAAVVIEVPATRDRIDGLILSISRDSATRETVRIVGDGILSDPVIHLRASTGGNIRATGNCTLAGADIRVENPRALIDLASCRHVSGVIRTPNPKGVSLPTTSDSQSLRIENTRQ